MLLGRQPSAQQRADNARDAGAWNDAADFYAAHLRLNPRDFDIWVQLGHSLKEAGRLNKALSAYQTALTLNGEDADLLLNLGHFYSKLGKLDNAAVYYRRSLAVDGNADAQRHLNWARKRGRSSPPREQDVVTLLRKGPPSETLDEQPAAEPIALRREQPAPSSQAHMSAKGEQLSVALLPLTPVEREHARHIASHALFDRDWYRAMHPDAANEDEPAEHFMALARTTSVDPGPGFAAAWYARTYADVGRAAIPAFLHYVLVGEAEGHAPKPAAAPALDIARAALAIDPGVSAPVVDWIAPAATQSPLTIGGIALGQPPADDGVLRALDLFLALQGWAAREAHGDGLPLFEKADRMILDSVDLIFADAWRTGPDIVTFRIEQTDAAHVVQVHGYQAIGNSLGRVGQAHVANGLPAFLRLRLALPLQPILLIFADPQGRILQGSLVPFPSLLRGGQHDAATDQRSGSGVAGVRDLSFAIVTDLIRSGQINGAAGRYDAALGSWINRAAAARLSEIDGMVARAIGVGR